ncbi:MAG: BMP family ABC transporter substrate-binding protein [Rhodocyclaceae bacterium]|nr:BMP family ABC transporter substrate-binding protein [Rhodocyclaceae bacterium]MCP5239774.1 BMP family ABC transporter substrate-binding protein [Zoogloeaceae bacterium]MCB1910984.1 BMP family ABC transporter substrate-binding protein [Rhodocyclaceae bacterium]MCP5253989.1 BMP family ABC transporter substrate-binding protein [Zoogloeaceae bacterium]MCP5293619.1 BMP family ABC transporter substrate-binding protein [Zoogloeaceae bacterium]
MTSRRTMIKSLAAVAGAAALPGAIRNAFAADPMKVGYVYVSPIGDAGWTFQHDLGRKQMESALAGKVVTKYVENVAEGADAERVIREFAASGNKLIFATSFGYMNYMERVARQFPKTVFMHATGYKMGKNMGIYNARFYEGRYLCGVIAGKMTTSNVLGYVAAFPIPEVLQGINAFIRGARSVNPKAEVRVIWVNSWYDPGKEREATTTLLSQGADVVTHHTDSTAVVQAAEEKGKYAFGYHSDMSKYGPKAHLTATTHQWGGFYTRTAQSVLDGSWKPGSVWGGYKESMIELSPINPVVPKEVVAMVTGLEEKLRAGTFHPFSGPVVDQDGKERLGAGEVMADDVLGKMDYFVEGVSSRLPKR